MLQNARLIFEKLYQDQRIQLWEDRQHRYLVFDDTAVQSIVSLDQTEPYTLPYLPLLLFAFELVPAAQQILILGLGGGCLARACWAHDNTATIVNVEHNPVVIEIAKTFFHLPCESARFRIYPTDAHTYLQTELARFDLIFSDLADSKGTPLPFQHHAFFQACYRALTPDGLVAFNFVLSTHEQFVTVITALRHIFHNQTFCLPLANNTNIIILARKKAWDLQAFDHPPIRDLTYDPEFGLFARAFA